MKFHLICERDVGLFSLIQSVISHVPWAVAEERIPIAYFKDRCSYYTPAGYHGFDTVWEYYFEPIVDAYPASTIPETIRDLVRESPPSPTHAGHWIDDDTFVSAHFGDHPSLEGKTLRITYSWEDPDVMLRRKTSEIIEKYVRPRQYICEKVEAFQERHLRGHYCIGLHVRGTDAISQKQIWGARRLDSLHIGRYVEAVRRVLESHPNGKILVATDDQRSLDSLIEALPERVIAYDAMRHTGGEAVGSGPTGWIMPSYISQDRDRAARNGEEAVIEYLLLSTCDILIHNGSALARTALLAQPDMENINTHPATAQNKLRSYLRYIVNHHQFLRATKKVGRHLRVTKATLR
jgi:hypothetical protein